MIYQISNKTNPILEKNLKCLQDLVSEDPTFKNDIKRLHPGHLSYVAHLNRLHTCLNQLSYSLHWNSCRSRMAEGILRNAASELIEVVAPVQIPQVTFTQSYHST